MFFKFGEIRQLIFGEYIQSYLIIFFFFFYRVFIFGMGDVCLIELIWDVVKVGNGKVMFVKDSDRLQLKVIKFLLCILYNVMMLKVGFV